MSDSVTTVGLPGSFAQLSLARLGAALAGYKQVSGRSAEQSLAKTGEKVILGNRESSFGAGFPGLRELFDLQAQRHGTITSAAMMRGFRLGRRRFGGTGVTRGISETAGDRATKLMGNNKSILAMVSYQDGRINLRGVRIGKRGKRITGGRRGTGGFPVAGDSALRRDGDVRLNFRAVATVMEINLREAGRKFLAAGFLLKRFQRIDKERVLRSVNPRSKVSLQSEATLSGAGTDNVTLRISSLVPGVSEIGSARGLFARVLGAVTADVETYLARKQRELLLRTVKSALS